MTLHAPALSAERPFPGLRPYDFDDHRFFFGRNEQKYALYRLLDRGRFIAVVGSSGSGKSSLVRAGLLPLLREESEEGGGHSWRSATMRPGDAPLAALVDALVGLAPKDEDPMTAAARRKDIDFALRHSSFGLSDAIDQIEGLNQASVVLIVDQFEELFRFATPAAVGARNPRGEARWREEAAKFVQLLLQAGRSRTRAVHVLVTMRSDFIGECARFHGLAEAVSACQYLVPSLTRDQLDDVIRQPIEAAGGTVEPELVERLLNDSSDELDQLPVLQHCLMRLWEHAGREPDVMARHLNLEHYRQIGRIDGALSQHADDIMRALPGKELTVEQVFRALSEIDKDGRATRRALLFSQLLAEAGTARDDLRQVVDRFRDDDCSFLVPPPSLVKQLADDARIDVGHEALLRRWTRVSPPPSALMIAGADPGWLRAEESDGQQYRVLLSTIDAEGLGRIPLQQVEERWRWWKSRPRTDAWAERHGGGLDQVHRLFLDSLADLKADRERQAAIKRAEETRTEQQQRIERERLEHQAAVAEAARRLAEAETARQLAEVEVTREHASRQEQEARAAQLGEAAAQRLASRTRAAAIAVSILLVIAIGIAAWAWQQRKSAEHNALMADQSASRSEQVSAIAVGSITTLVGQVKDGLSTGNLSTVVAKDMLKGAEGSLSDLLGNQTLTPEIAKHQIELFLFFSDALFNLGELDEALKRARSARTIAAQFATKEPDNLAWQRHLYGSAFRIGDLLAQRSNFSGAVDEYRTALKIAEQAAPKEPANNQWKLYVAFIHNKVGDIYKIRGEIRSALSEYNAGLSIVDGLAVTNTSDEIKRERATALTRIGDAIAAQLKWDEALAPYGSAVEIRKDLGCQKPQGPGSEKQSFDDTIPYRRPRRGERRSRRRARPVRRGARHPAGLGQPRSRQCPVAKHSGIRSPLHRRRESTKSRAAAGHRAIR